MSVRSAFVVCVRAHRRVRAQSLCSTRGIAQSLADVRTSASQSGRPALKAVLRGVFRCRCVLSFYLSRAGRTKRHGQRNRILQFLGRSAGGGPNARAVRILRKRSRTCIPGQFAIPLCSLNSLGQQRLNALATLGKLLWHILIACSGRQPGLAKKAATRFVGVRQPLGGTHQHSLCDFFRRNAPSQFWRGSSLLDADAPSAKSNRGFG